MFDHTAPAAERQPASRVGGPLRVFLGVLVSFCCFVLLLRGVQWDAVGLAFGGVRLLPLLGAVAIEFITIWAMAARWQCLFVPCAPPPRVRLFQILTIAQLVNGVLPAKLGPLVRAYLAGGGQSTGVAFVLTTIVGEKLVEGASLVLIAVGLLPFVPLPEWLRTGTWVSAALLLVALALVFWIAFRQDTAEHWLRRLLDRWPRLLRVGQSALDALKVWQDRRAVADLVGWSLLIWVITGLLNQLLLWSLGIEVSLAAPLLLLVVLQIGVRMPSSPGSIGVIHYLSVLVLTLFGVEKELALVYGVLLHLVMYLPVSLVGIVYLARSGYSLGRLRQAVAAVPVQAELGAHGEGR